MDPSSLQGEKDKEQKDISPIDGDDDAPKSVGIVRDLLDVSTHSQHGDVLSTSRQSTDVENDLKLQNKEGYLEKSRHARFSAEEFVTILNVSSIDEVDGDGQSITSITRGGNNESDPISTNGAERSTSKGIQSAMRTRRFAPKRDTSNSSIGSHSYQASYTSGSITSWGIRSANNSVRTRSNRSRMLTRRMSSATRQASLASRRSQVSLGSTSRRSFSRTSAHSNRSGFGRLIRKHSSIRHDEEKIRILALHGKQANKEVTRMQLENLHITPDRYDIVYLKGPIPEDEGDSSITNLVNGPFYSWFHSDHLDPRFKPSLLHAIVYLLEAIKERGPFDAIYGFSQGATIATIVAIAYLDAAMRKAITDEYNDFLWSQASPSQSEVGSNEVQDRRSLLRQNQSKKKSFKNAVASVRNLVGSTSHSSSFDVSVFDEEPFSYMILACAVGLPQKLMTAFGFSRDYLEPSCINIPSMHLIGIDDPCRPMGEDMLTFFCDAQTRYMIGGHGISRHIESDKDTLRILHDGLNNLDNGVSMRFSDMTKISGISSIAPMYKWQVAAVELDGLMDSPTIPVLLETKDPSKPLFYNARGTDSSNYLSYGDVLDFIRGGPGDLRRLGVKEGEVVAYVAPGNGGAVAALAFLSICSQTTAAPMAPNTVEKDAIYLIEKYDAKHLIIFDSAECPGLESAQAQLVTSGQLKLHRAQIRSLGSQPGMFDYIKTGSRELDPRWIPSTEPLQNPCGGVGLLLSTSGTTSRPKGVPILHGALVHNGEIIASSLGLDHTDICYSIMPLFHIGGIAASIMCTMASGGAVCCDGEAYNPEKMVEAIALSQPQPTWYSAVPTIHNATVSFIKAMAGSSDALEGYGISKDGVWKEGHSLRFIRSGAAALLGPDATLLSATYGDIPVYPTYSMSEQMPISQPPEGKNDMIRDKPGSVGVPVAASVAIVSTKNLKILPYGEEGEIAISGGTVIEHYLNNKEADAKAFFALTLNVGHNSPYAHGRYFLTGDIGVLDKQGFLTLKGRNKEMIKKGGEQITPMEVEEPLTDHPWVEIVVCFSVPSKVYGEEVGCAIVLSSFAPEGVDLAEVTKELKDFLRVRGLPPLKWPTKWKLLSTETELPKTKTKKFIRVGLAEKLGMLEENTENNTCPINPSKQTKNTFIDWNVISGFRFCLSCYVMFMHIGSNQSWGAVANLRGWPWHVHVFFTLGGFSMAAPMNPAIAKKLKYFFTRIGTMYPMYIVALVFALINLLVTCRPSTFRPDFSWNARPDDLYIDGDETKGHSPLFCEGTPVTPTSYWASLSLTLFIYIIGAPISPIWVMNWWMGYYFWFSAMYYQCLLIFPTMYNFLLKRRSNCRWYILSLISVSTLNYIILGVTWLLVKDAEGYNMYNTENGEKNNEIDYNQDAFLDNAIVLGWYLFSPFWMLYFVIGAYAAFLYDAYRPAEKTNRYIWGFIADGCTMIVIIWSIFIGHIGYDIGATFYLRPKEANNFTDTSSVNRIWDSICGRLFAPLTTLWIFALSTGRGFTASVLRSEFLVEIVAPHSYNCFLFHQMVAQWYYAATRNGDWWNWWRYRKNMYWFSPAPCPVEWYEYFYLVGLTVCFSALMNATMQPAMNALLLYFKNLIIGESGHDEATTEESLLVAIEDMTGFAPELDWTLDQCGLSSVGLPILAARLKEAFSTKTSPLNITTAALSAARTVEDLVKVLEEIKRLSESEGV